MRLTIGEFVDDFISSVVDTKMLEILNRTGRTKMIIDRHIKDSVVDYPIPSILISPHNKILIDAFRTVGSNILELNFVVGTQSILASFQESRQTTSNLERFVKQPVAEQLHGLGLPKSHVNEKEVERKLEKSNYCQKLKLKQNKICLNLVQHGDFVISELSIKLGA
ncbi:hypothetical protein DINM_002680 [Dirofilaria immitis]|nr:hypothetical protein [Dirofilaria immitis]